ncbi:hypothetical protein MKX08_003125 [Trichoderma sp. CBMAI-0020]|nr:hypothetical protein MKX08_003125 [Trichoderma sp. CBMAI-0020]
MTAQGVASWTEIADGTLCGRDPDEIGVPARWALDGTEDERQGFSQSREKGGFPGGSAGEGASGRSAVLDAATIPVEGEATQAEATLI